MNSAEVQKPVIQVAKDALADNGYVAPIDVLVRMRWLVSAVTEFPD